jgi:hypothetical protein
MTTPSDGRTGTLPVQSGDQQIVYVREPSHWLRRLLVFMGTVALLIAVVFGLMTLNLIPSFSNPFAAKTTDRSGPVLLDSMKDMSKYVAAEGNFQVLVDLQKNSPYVPDFLYNDRILFVGVGSVNAYVDFSQLTAGNIIVSADGNSVTVNLPPPQLEKPNLDSSKSYVFAEDRGAVNRLGDLFSNDPNRQQQLYQLAEDKIAQAARDSELVSRAKTNTKLMLESLLKQLGFQRVTINFVGTP